MSHETIQDKSTFFLRDIKDRAVKIQKEENRKLVPEEAPCEANAKLNCKFLDALG